MAYSTLAFYGNTVFEQNRGRALVVSRIIISNDVLLTITVFKVLASRVDVSGSIQFVGNNVAGIHGGALYLASLSQMVLSPGSSLIFKDNTGM